MWGEAELLHCNDNYISNALETWPLESSELPIQMEGIQNLETCYTNSMNFISDLSGKEILPFVNPDDLSFNFTIRATSGGDPDGLYFYFEVKDDSVIQSSPNWPQNDGIEIILQYYGKSDTLTDSFRWVYGQTNEVNGKDSVEIVWQETNDGYAAEVIIDKAALNFPLYFGYHYALEIEVVDVDSEQEGKIGHWYSPVKGIDDTHVCAGLLELPGGKEGDCPCESGITTDHQMIHTFTLSPNYPNPFNPYTTIDYSLSGSTKVNLKIFDVTGREVEEVLNEYQGAGTHQVIFDASGLPSGVYVYKLQAGNQVEQRKMTLVK